MELKKLDLYGGLSLVSFDFDKYISNLSQIPMTSNDFSYLKNFLSHVNQEWNLTKKAKSIKIDPKILLIIPNAKSLVSLSKILPKRRIAKILTIKRVVNVIIGTNFS